METNPNGRKCEKQLSDFEMSENDEKKSSSDFFCNCALFVVDYLLFLVIFPVCAIANWIGTYYFLVFLNKPDTWYDELKIALITISVIIFAAKHVFRGLIYKFIRDHIESETAFYIISKIYIYLFSLCGTIVFAGIFESKYFSDLITVKKSNAGSTNTSTTDSTSASTGADEPESDPLYCVAITIIGFFFLFCLKCRPHLAGGVGDVGREKTAEEVFLFPTTFSGATVLFSEHIGNRFLYFFSSRLYTQIFGIASVSSWYGVWNAFDSLTGGNIKITVVIVLISYVGLFCTKTVRNITSSPFALITDRRQGYFDVPTLFQWSNIWKKNKCLYILDSIFSVFIVGTLVILVWRGAWCLLDQTIFPGEQTYLLSGWISLGIGYSIVFATFALQRFMKILIRMYHGWKRLVIIDTYVVISFCGTINIWRGIWILLEVYADLEHSILACVILHFVSFFILVIFNSSNTLLVRGVYIDAEENGEDCVEFPCYYFRLRFQEKQKKKTLVELNMATNQIHSVDEKDDVRLNQLEKKPESEIITEINPQQIPLILNDSQNGNGPMASKEEKPES